MLGDVNVVSNDSTKVDTGKEHYVRLRWHMVWCPIIKGYISVLVTLNKNDYEVFQILLFRMLVWFGRYYLFITWSFLLTSGFEWVWTKYVKKLFKSVNYGMITMET